jgi:putative SOS response-associated peptidase YedK
LAYSTNKARSEELSTKAPYKRSRQDGKRCIIPA